MGGISLMVGGVEIDSWLKGTDAEDRVMGEG